jgi:signal transduction histidine kinase
MNRYWPRCRYIRLRHRVFAAIVLSIVVTAAFVVLATHLVGSGGYRGELSSVERFAGERFAEVWDSPERRRDLALAIERSFAVSLTLREPNGQIIYGDGLGCAKPDYRLNISGPVGDLGSVALCWNHSKRHGTAVAIGLFAGALVLWVASGGIARRLARPVDELLRVAREIGQGNLAARMRLRRHHRDEVGEIAEAVNDMAVRIERQVSGQRELLAAVSHEIRTPLARLRVLVELERTKPEDQKRLDAIEAELIEIDSLVGQLLAQSKLDFSALDRRQLNAADLANAALERAGLDSNRLNVKGDRIFVDGDPSLIARALANLIDNAQRHGNGLNELTVYCEDNCVSFVALDRGVGIAIEVLPRLFLPFERRGDNAGLGLGLALVERIARAHGGRAFAEARQGGGAAVGFRIPIGLAVSA